MKNKKIAPTLLHSDAINPNIKFEQTPFYLQKEVSNWDKPIIEGKEYPRIASISSFGAGGVNVHAIVQEVEIEKQTNINKDKYIFVLSALSKESLNKYAIKMKKFLLNNKEIDMNSFIYTLQIGRINLPYKIGFITEGLEDAISKLNSFINNKNYVEAKMNSKRIIHPDLKVDSYDKLLNLWMNGADVKWQELYDSKLRKVSIPPYPFDNKRYWVSDDKQQDENKNLVDTNKKEDKKIVEKQSNNSETLNNLINAFDYERKDIIEYAITGIVQDLLNFEESSQIDINKGFFELGMESIMIGKFKQSIEKEFNLSLEDTVLFNYANIKDLSEYIYEEIDFNSLEHKVQDKETDYYFEEEELMDLLEEEIQIAEEKRLFNRGK